MKKWRLDFRLWHWINAFVILGLLSTVFLRKTFLSWRTNSELLVQKLSEINIDITSKQATVLAKAIRAPMWEWHIILGYALAALAVWRILLFFTQSGKENYINFKEQTLHYKMVKIGYLIFYAIIAFMSISGLLMVFHEELGLIEETVKSLKELHELVYNGVLIFVPLHLLGVIAAEQKEDRGIISDMINGGKK
ncbi:MAG: cytochrome b/b6 domain-containing protein [Sulfurovum sp.]|nr:cytochrome b/b6 domain-containing protein [Sulfurovum sp.]